MEAAFFCFFRAAYRDVHLGLKKQKVRKAKRPRATEIMICWMMSF